MPNATDKPVPTRSKLDSRLALLLRMRAAEVEAIRAYEHAQLEEIGAAIQTATLELQEWKDERSPAWERYRQLQARQFAPVTAGLNPAKAADDATIESTDAVLSVFIVGDISPEDLERLGARVRSQSGKVATAYVPATALMKLEACPAVEYIELGRAMLPTLNEAIPLSGIDQLHLAPGGPLGKNVYVGVIDSTLDLYHADFRETNGATRVRWLWDQTLFAQAGEASPAPYTYGVEYDAQAIDAQLNATTGGKYDKVRHNAAGEVGSHGTRVTGIAAGGGKGSANYRGAAPEASIIFVSHRRLASGVAADLTEIADAFAYIFARADRACVVNLSNGDNLGAHDGTSPAERFLDSLLAQPGRAITLSTGNSNNTASHTSGTVAASGTATITLNCIMSVSRSFGAEIWYDGGDQINARAKVSGTWGPSIIPGQDAPDVFVNPGNIRVSLSSRANDPGNGDNCITLNVVIPPNQEMPFGSKIDIELAGAAVVDGHFHAWVDRNNRNALNFSAPVEGTLTLGTPGTAHLPITVGNHEKLPTRQIARDSGRGPTRDARVKPEIAAAGTNVVCTWSVNRSTSNANGYGPLTGTSASAPLVAGACACLFECRGPTLTAAQLKQILVSSAGTVGLNVPDDAFGYGYLQAATCCTGISPAVDTWMRDSADDTGVEPYLGPVAWLSPDIEALDLQGQPVGSPTASVDGHPTTIVRVTVRNRGTSQAANTDVYLYWADPATNIPYPAAWKRSGIFTGPGLANASNVVSVATLGSQASVQVEFGWAPPVPGSNLQGDDHFCLLARVENAQDPSGVAGGGWSVVSGRNNIALHNLHVLPYTAQLQARTRFHCIGAAGRNSLVVSPTFRRGVVQLAIPFDAMPWRDPELRSSARPYLGARREGSAFEPARRELEPPEIRRFTGIDNARLMRIADGMAIIEMDAPNVLRIEELRLAAGARMTAELSAQPGAEEEGPTFVHVSQRADGALVGGVSVKLCRV